MRPLWAPRAELQPHTPEALKPALRPLLPDDCELRVRTLGELRLVVGVTLDGHRIAHATHIPPRTMPAADWARQVVDLLRAWRPPAAPLPPAPISEADTRPPEPAPAAPLPPAPAARPAQLALAL